MEEQFRQLLASNDANNITIAILQLPNFDVNIEPLLVHNYNLLKGCYDNMDSDHLQIGDDSTFIKLQKNDVSCCVRVVVRGVSQLNKVFLVDKFSTHSFEDVFKSLKKC